MSPSIFVERFRFHLANRMTSTELCKNVRGTMCRAHQMAPPSKASLWKAKVYAHALSEGIARLAHQRSVPIDDCVRLDLDQLSRIDETRDVNHRACRPTSLKIVLRPGNYWGPGSGDRRRIETVTVASARSPSISTIA